MKVADQDDGRIANLLGSLGVLAVACAIALGLPALDRGLPAARPVLAGRPYNVGGCVWLVPPPGALLDVTKTRPLPDRGSALFLVGLVRYVVVAAPFTGALESATDRLRRKITSNRGYQVTGPVTPIALDSALAGLAGGYTAPGRVGRYMVFLAPETAQDGATQHGTVIEVTISGAQADLARALTDVQASVRTLTCRPIGN